MPRSGAESSVFEPFAHPGQCVRKRFLRAIDAVNDRHMRVRHPWSVAETSVESTSFRHRGSNTS
jgi:hypothetical protein